MCLYGQDVHATITHAVLRRLHNQGITFSWDSLALGGILFVGDVEQGEVCAVFPFARAGSGVPVMTSSVGDCVVGVPVELPGITDKDPNASVGRF